MSRWREKPDGTWERNRPRGGASKHPIQFALAAGIVFGLIFALALRLLGS